MNKPVDRIGDWVQTYTGLCFWPLDPRAEEIDIRDIAHSLAMKCRYGGHSKRFYSVAEHSILVSLHVPAEYRMWGLLHDAAEAYSSDIPRPLKRSIPGWKEMESSIMRAVCERFGLPPEEPDAVKSVDYAITSDERVAVMNTCVRDWSNLLHPVGARIECLRWEAAEAAFLDRFLELAA